MIKNKIGLHMPHVITLIFMLIVFVAIMTWIIPSGSFERQLVDTAAGEREVAVSGTYTTVKKVTEEVDLRQGIAQVLQAPGKGIQRGIEVIAFVFIIGGVFSIMDKTKAMNVGLKKLVSRLGNKSIILIPILMMLFGLGGSTFGMSDELVPFYLLLMPIILSMGYDSMTVFLIVCGGATMGYAASTINPFSVLIAQGVAGIKGNPQLIFRMMQFVIIMTIIIGFTIFRAIKIKAHPEKSVTFENDKLFRRNFSNEDKNDEEIFTGRQRGVLIIFLIGLCVVVFGLIKFGWYMNELSMVFLGMGILWA
ncbi:C4-dicarboxylate anaerobic carrier [Lachnospiraceae bacterium oral taxon 082 str. F0431]|nr:C4-dicarboxylate anaerobic carrier [Lachnospiraceae bacterium oral taxon 082 str. F0431]